MNTSTIHFSCPRCRARIKAPVQLIGKKRDCPGCRHTLLVPHVPPEDAGPLLVLLEGNDRFSLGIRHRTSPPLVRRKEQYRPKQGV